MTTSKSFPTRTAGNRPKPSAERTPRSAPRPGTITAIQAQVTDAERVSVFIDGEFALGVGRDVAESLGLTRGVVLDQDQIDTLVATEEKFKATTVALNFLAYRPRSEGEIRRRLLKGGFSDPAIETTLEKLRDWRYVDDADFAQRWIENRVQHRPRGTRLLAQELKAKGISPDVANMALDDAAVDERADALRIARARARQLGDLEPEVRERRLNGFLARRGYGFEIVRTTLIALRADPHESVELEE